jgi:hypothetical protein
MKPKTKTADFGLIKPEKPEIKQEIKRNKGKFVKGVSGNPLGKPKGIPNKKTVEKRIAEEEFKDRILLNIHELLNAQMNIAKGSSFLYKIEESGEGKNKRREHILVTDPEEIKEVLDECEGDGLLDDNYYYITTKMPDNRALDSLIDRVFGKPKESLEVEFKRKLVELDD